MEDKTTKKIGNGHIGSVKGKPIKAGPETSRKGLRVLEGGVKSVKNDSYRKRKGGIIWRELNQVI